MNLYAKYLVGLLCLISNSVIHSRAEVVITNEELDSFSFGSPEFQMAIIGDR